MRRIVTVVATFAAATVLASGHRVEAGGTSAAFRALAMSPGVASSPRRGNGPEALVIPVQDGGPDFWEVTGVPPGDKLNIRSGIGTGYPVIARVPNGEILRNLGCRRTGSSRWCEVETRNGRVRGYVAGRYLRESGGGFAGGGSSGDVPELFVRNSGEIEVRWSRGCTMLYNSRGNRIQSGSSCSRSQRNRSDDAVERYLREQGGSTAEGGGGAGGAMDIRGYGNVTQGGQTIGHIVSKNGRSYALIIAAARDGFTCTGSFDRAPGSRDSMSTRINCTNGASGSAILTRRNNGYFLTFSTSRGQGGYVQFR